MGKKLTSRDIQAENTRRKVIEKAFELVRKYGYDEITVNQICKACGVSKGTFYHYFDSKKDIIAKMTSHLNEELYDRFIFDPKLTAEKLYKDAVDVYLEKVDSDGHSFTSSYVNAMITANIGEKDTGIDLQQEFIYKILDKGIKDGEFCKDINKYDFYMQFRITLMGCLTIWCFSDGSKSVFDFGQKSLHYILMLIKV